MSSESKFQIMKSIDLAIIEQINKAKESPQYQTLQDQYDLLEDNMQTVVKYGLFVIASGIPIIIVLISFTFYSLKSSELDTHELIISKASEIIAKSSQIDDVGKDLFGRPIPTEAFLKNQMTSILGRVAIDPQKVIISDFNKDETAGISEISTSLQFNDISSTNFYSLIESLSVTKKFKIKTINLEKNEQSQLLKGKIELLLYSKEKV